MKKKIEQKWGQISTIDDIYQGVKKSAHSLNMELNSFMDLVEIPTNGTNSNFNLTTQIGAEYTTENKIKLRLGYGHIHQSN